MKPERLASELRRHRRDQFTKWFAYWIVLFTVSWFAIHFIMGAI
jgi:hypothetical protein